MPTINWEQRYQNAKVNLLEDAGICKENRDLFAEFFEYQENRLKRINGLRKLDNNAYNTLYYYVQRFKNANKWFDNKAWKKLTKEDIKKVYDDLEDGIIKRRDGKPFEDLKSSYYSKVFKSKPFEMAGKLEIAKEVIQYAKSGVKEVRFILEDDFKKIVNNAYKPHHRLLLWLAWDIGENINALLKLKKSDFCRQQNPYTKEDEYRVNLKKEILKRSRRPRSEITNYNETVELLDSYFGEHKCNECNGKGKIQEKKCNECNGEGVKTLKDNELLFNFDYRNAKKIVDRAVERAGVKCIPNGEKVTWKDLRSGMACDLLKKGYTTDEVNARLGHKPSSDEIDKYINFLAIDRHTPKKKVHQFEMEKLNEELEEVKKRERLQLQRNQDMQEQVEGMQMAMEEFNKKLRLVELYEQKFGKV